MDNPKCEYCELEAVEKRKIIIDVEPDGENQQSVWGDVWLCEEHLIAHEEREGMFDPFDNL